MKTALLKASLKDSYKSMLICFGVLLAYGLMIMGIFPSMEDTFSDPMAEGKGIVLTEIGKDEQGYQEFNLSWDTRIGAGAHVAVGVSSPFTHAAFKGFLEENDTARNAITEDEFREAVENRKALDEYGVRILYNGTEKWIEFSRTDSSSYFFVVYIVGNGNFTPVNVSDVVSSMELVQTTVFDDYLKDNAFMEGFLGNANLDFTTIEGFVSIEYMSMWPLFLAIFLGVKGGGVVSRHVEDLSMDMLLATGYTRSRFLSEKLTLLVINLVVVLLGGYAGLAVGGLMIGESLYRDRFSAICTDGRGIEMHLEDHGDRHGDVHDPDSDEHRRRSLGRRARTGESTDVYGCTRPTHQQSHGGGGYHSTVAGRRHLHRSRLRAFQQEGDRRIDGSL